MYNMLEIVKVEIKQLAKKRVSAFNASLIPDEDLIYGLTMNEIRNVAKKIGNPLCFMEVNDYSSYELKQIQACLISRIKDIEIALIAFEKFMPYVDSWAVCDNLCQSFKLAKKYPDKVLGLLRKYYADKHEFIVRIVAVMLMTYYLDDKYIDEVLNVYDRLYLEDYYAKMAVAWGLATAMAKQRAKTYMYLLDNHLDDWTYNKAIQKMIESYRISDEDKAILKKMKR